MTRIFWLCAVLALSGGLSGQPGVSITTTSCGTSEVGLFVWGQLPGSANPPAINKSACGSAATVAVTPDATGHDQLASFAVGTAPQLLTPNWGTGAVSVTQPAAAQVAVKFW